MTYQYSWVDENGIGHVLNMSIFRKGIFDSIYKDLKKQESIFKDGKKASFPTVHNENGQQISCVIEIHISNGKTKTQINVLNNFFDLEVRQM